MSNWYIASEENISYLAHHGIQGQKWGIRRYQNEDGSLTEEGRRRYGLDKPTGWGAQNSGGKTKMRGDDIIKAIKKEAKANKEKLTDEELFKRVKKEYNKIYKDKKLADIMNTMDMSYRKYRKMQAGPRGILDMILINAISNSNYNKNGYESPLQSLDRAGYEYRNYYNKDKKVPDKYINNKKKYKTTF